MQAAHWQCAVCGEIVEGGVEKCPNCGAPPPEVESVRPCPVCQGPIPIGANRCPFCRTSAIQPADLERAARRWRWWLVALVALVGLPAGVIGACNGYLAVGIAEVRPGDRAGLVVGAICGLALFGWLTMLLIRNLRS